MNENDITITITESQHELLRDVLLHAADAVHLASPYCNGLYDLPIDNSIVQRYTMIENMQEMLNQLWIDRFEEQ